MTKAEVRAVSIAKLGLTRQSVFYDIGAGTGSVSIEAALHGELVQVYAIEQREDACELIRANRRKFRTAQVQVIHGSAPEAMEGLPAPTHAFIGGSTGHLHDIIRMLKEKNPKATIITTPWDELKGEQILAAMEHQDLILKEEMEHLHEHEDHEHCCDHDHDHEHEHHHDHDHEHHHDHEHGDDCTCGCHDHDHDHHHHHHADEVFSSWGQETPHKYSEEQLRDILKKLSDGDEYGIILRAKGIIPCADGTWLHFDMVPEEYEIRRGDADYTGRLCVIGSHLDEEELAKLFGLA